ncbi:uncharacterized protein PV09_01503 [Verruconis gallopava]|uniref:Uncharacterized protein n=1 Tax=Verruconis gallopava TaxID=253628 RepID=A0A0D2B8J7_9PEZI|nr:uncharacterized protein PV09_01503 [Verruconis gallopava]KIW07544.1 hypothetical protein PV09_01503 [Verruconis gallopava]
MEGTESQEAQVTNESRKDGSAVLQVATKDAVRRPTCPTTKSSSDAETLVDAQASDDPVHDPSVGGQNTVQTTPSTSHHVDRPSMRAKAGSDIPPKGPRASFLGLQRFATASQVPARQSNLVYTQGEDAEIEPSNDSSEDEGTCKPSATARDSRPRNRAYERYSRFRLGNDYFSTIGKVRRRDGRLNISLNETDSSGYLAKALGTGFRHHFFHRQELDGQDESKSSKTTQSDDKKGKLPQGLDDNRDVPRLNIVIIVIGSRGDIQPFLKVGKILKQEYGHRVRIATHPAFKDFVEKDGKLEFFSVGGDPSDLMAFMVKNPGLVPSIETIRAGDISARRAQMAEMFEGMWRACINATDNELDKDNMKMMGRYEPFIADAIIANPPSFAHIHIAERLGVPLHLMFTFPYTPTTQFPHPLANIKSTNVDHAYANFMSYPLVELMTWQGLGDLINRFRVHTLGLEEVSTLWAPGQLYRMAVPFTYMWSPGLVPKPQDYGDNIDICGFVFLDLGSSYKPPEPLQKFLDAGEPPVYIGFGSIVVDDPNAFTAMIFEAVKLAGVRALVSKGWGGLGSGEMEIPENIFLLEDTPHDWLFPRVQAVIHHGGAGTTAIGLKCGKPSMIVPFFGDQPFWGAMVAKKRAGAFECIPYKRLTAEKLAEGIKQCLTDEARQNALKIAESIAAEGDGALNAVKSFHKHLNLSGSRSIRCSILENRVAVWKIKNLDLKLSALAAEILAEQKKIRWQDLRLVRHNEWNDFEGPGGPITGVLGPILTTVLDIGKETASIPLNAGQSIKSRKKRKAKKRRLERRKRKSEDVNDNTIPSYQSAKGKPSRPPEGQTSLQRQLTSMSALSTDPSEPLVEEVMKQIGHGLKEAGKAFLNLPMNIIVGVAQGFHNAPRLYGDETVRKPRRISGYRSGLRAGRDELFYGIWDGWTGVVTQPYHGAKEHGVVGALEGTAIGIGGLFLKNIAALFGPIAYTAKGIEKEILKSRQPTKFIRKARMIQGSKELRALEATASSSREVFNETQPGTFHPVDGETLESVRNTVEEGWSVIMELLDAMEEKRNKKKKNSSDGPLKLKSKLGFSAAEKRWHESGALESIHTAKIALEAKKAGKDIGESLDERRRNKQSAVDVVAR